MKLHKITIRESHGINKTHNHKKKTKRVLSIKGNKCENKLRKNKNSKCNKQENSSYNHRNKKGKNMKKRNKKNRKSKRKRDEKSNNLSLN